MLPFALAFGFVLGAGVGLLLVMLTLMKATRRAVATMNDRSVGVLAELAEGRRIEAEVPYLERTIREQLYVAQLRDAEAHGSKVEQGKDDDLREAGSPEEGPEGERGGEVANV